MRYPLGIADESENDLELFEDAGTDLEEDGPDGRVEEFASKTRGFAEMLGTLLAALIIGALVIFFFVVIIVAIGFLVKFALAADPGDVQPDPNDGWIGQVVEDRGVIWASRILILMAGFAGVLFLIWVGTSVVARIKNRHWLRAGFGVEAETTKAISDLELGAQEAFELLDSVQEERDLLREQLEATTSALEAMTEERDIYLNALEIVTDGDLDVDPELDDQES